MDSLFKGLLKRRAIARRVEQVDGDAIRMGGNRRLEDLVLLDDVGLLRVAEDGQPLAEWTAVPRKGWR